MLLTGESGIAAGAAPQRESVCGVWILHRAHANDAAALPLHSWGCLPLPWRRWRRRAAPARRGCWWPSPQSAAAAVTGVGAFCQALAAPRGPPALGALLAFPQLAAARAPYVMTDSNIRTAVAAWLSDSASAETTYGHISAWATGGVTDMSFVCSELLKKIASSRRPSTRTSARGTLGRHDDADVHGAG